MRGHAAVGVIVLLSMTTLVPARGGPGDACLDLLGPGPAADGRIFADGFERGLAEWSVAGGLALPDCTQGSPEAPSLAVAPLCCDEYVYVRHDLGLALDRPLAFGFSFKAEGASATDADFVIQSPGFEALLMHLSGGWTNRDMTLTTLDHGFYSYVPFFTWREGEWYAVTMHVDPAARSFRAEVRNAQGEVVAYAPPAGLPVGFTTIASISFQSTQYGLRPGVFHFDDVWIGEDVPAAPAVLAERWDAGLAGWTVVSSGAGTDCTEGTPACSLRIDPACCASYTKVGKYGLEVAVDRPLVARFDFRGSGGASTDGDFVLGFEPGDAVSLHLSGGPSNRALTLYTIDHGEHAYTPFFVWEPGTWYTATLYVDPWSGVSRAEVRALSGALVAASGTQPLPAGERVIRAVVFQDIEYSVATASHHYDSLEIRYAS